MEEPVAENKTDRRLVRYSPFYDRLVRYSHFYDRFVRYCPFYDFLVRQAPFYMIFVFIFALVKIYFTNCRAVRSCYMDETMSEGEVIEHFHECFASPSDIPICTDAQLQIRNNDYLIAVCALLIFIIDVIEKKLKVHN